jgi:hypothetical protein
MKGARERKGVEELGGAWCSRLGWYGGQGAQGAWSRGAATAMEDGKRERGCVGSWRTDRLFAKELGKSGVLKSGVLITRKKRRGRQRWCKQGKSYGRNMYNGIME